MRTIDGNSQEYLEMQRLGTLAKAIVSRPSNTNAWIKFSINPNPPVPKGSVDFERGCNCYSSINESTTLEKMAEWAFILLTRDDEWERRAGFYLRWAIGQHLMDRRPNLTEQEWELLQKVSV